MIDKLVCPVGQSFGVVTEVLWCMLQEQPGERFVPRHVAVLSTDPPFWKPLDRSSDHPEERLLVAALDDYGEPGPGPQGAPNDDMADLSERFRAFRALLKQKIDLLYTEQGEDAPTFWMLPAQRDDGSWLGDAQETIDGIAYEEALLELMRQTISVDGTVGGANDPDVRMHVTMAGGRKFMSSGARLHIVTVGRPEDRLWDLKTEPFQISLPGNGLWWPGHFHDGQPTGRIETERGSGNWKEGIQVTATLQEVPVRAYGDPLMPRALLDYHNLKHADRTQGFQPIEFDMTAQSISCRGEGLFRGEEIAEGSAGRLTPGRFWILALLALMRKLDCGLSSGTASNEGTAGWFSTGDPPEKPYQTTDWTGQELITKIASAHPDDDTLNAAVKGLHNAVELTGGRFLAGFPLLAKQPLSEVRRLLKYRPYLEDRLQLVGGRVEVRLDDGTVKKRTGIRIGAKPQDLVFVNVPSDWSGIFRT
ncbi:MAG: CRISPR-associated ring nuclease [Shimia sp.]